MYLSTTNETITLSVCALWDSSLDIYDPNVKAIELGIGIINVSKADLNIDQISLRVRKNPFIFYSEDDLPITIPDQLIPTNSRLDFTYDLKPILNLYGDQRRIYFKVTSGKTKIESRPLTISRMNKSIIAIYARHF